ncbi:MAG TPA: sigma-70 family RNA polymerase sigma factor [Fimbriimonadales bacterium]|nr:sigma-70 family RNA polymerase sigma factor [Fimbriimonadales bacterium]
MALRTAVLGTTVDSKRRGGERGNPIGFGEFVARERNKAIRRAYRLLGDRELAEDIVQEAFMRAARSWDKHMETHQTAWFYKILHNEAIRAWKKNRKVEAIDPCHEDIRYDHDNRIAVREVFKKMDFRDVEILVLAYEDGMTYEEISEILGIPAGTVASRINAAKDKFKKMWGA